MASTKTEKTANSTPEIKPPAGYEEGGLRDIDGWYKPQPNVVVHGKIIGHTVVPGDNGPREVVLLELLEETLGYTKGDKVGTMLQPGQILAVTVSFGLKEMLEYVEHKGNSWFVALEKKKTRGSRSMWTYRQFYKGRKGKLPQAAQFRTDTDDDIDF